MTGTPLADLVGPKIGALVAQGHTPGVAVAAVRGADRVVVCRGIADRATGAAIGPDTSFELGSLTKTCTTLLLANMATRGEVGYHDPIAEHLPLTARPREQAAGRITLLDLATHTSGLPKLPGNFYRRALPHWLTDPYAHYHLDDLFEATARLRPRRPPGTGVRYSTFGVGLLGQLLAAAAGRDYRGLVTERVLDPLGLSGSTLEPTTATATAHRRGKARPHWHFDALAPAGAWCATPNDLLRYLTANIEPTGSPLADAITAAQLPRHRNGTVENCLGWSRRAMRGHILLWHTGATSGSLCFVGFSPTAGAGVALLANAAPTPRQPILRAARKLFGKLVPEYPGTAPSAEPTAEEQPHL
ncbi:serine hydrolase domain-containing protein [Actinokineospora iranica]|nr:serine hydrolase domain-containing protein [Actinokineospora iranica]